MTGLRRLFGEGFRVFFLTAGLYAVFVMIVWEGWLGIQAAGGTATSAPFAQAPQLWHAHELIFGYATAAMGGFFLTAVPNWTGAKAARHLFILTAAGLWLAGRLAVGFSAGLPAWLVAMVDLAFLPVLAAKILTQLVRRPKPQNLMFLGLIAILWAGNLMVHLEWTGATSGTAWAGLRAGLLGTCAMIAVLGGRVTPAFTRNAMVQAGRTTGLPRSHRALEAVGIAAAVLLPVLYIAGLDGMATGLVALTAGLATLARLAGWRGLWTGGRPILWSLHLGFAMLGAGYLSLGLAVMGWGSEVAAVHLLGIGAVGGMTLAVMSRATLGHTGRPLVAPGPVVLAYAMIALAALVRWAGSAVPAWYEPAVLASGALWLVAFTIYTATLWPVFWGPRAAPEAGAAA